MQYLGDYAEDYATLNFKFSTHKSDGTPITLAGTPVVKVYKANSTTTETATGVTLTVDFDSVTGLHNVLIDLSADAFYATGNDYSVVITTGTVDSVSVVGTVLANFSIQNRYQMQTGDVYAPIANATYGLSALSARIPAALTANGNMKASLVEILTTALTETAGYLAAGFKKFFNVETPVSTVESVNQSADNNVILADASKGLAKVYDDMSKPGTAQTITPPTDMALDSTVMKAASYTAPPTAADIKTALEADGSKLDHLWETTEDDGGVRRFTTTALEQAPSSGSAPTAVQIRQEMDSNSTKFAAILEDTGTTIPALINSDSGAGAISHTYTLTDSADGNPIDGAEVWVTTDAAGVNVIASGTTNSSGIVTFMLDAGTYYFWRRRSGYNFTNPDLETVA